MTLISDVQIQLDAMKKLIIYIYIRMVKCLMVRSTTHVLLIIFYTNVNAFFADKSRPLSRFFFFLIIFKLTIIVSPLVFICSHCIYV